MSHPNARRIARIMSEHARSVRAGISDPLTRHYGAREFVIDSALAATKRELKKYGLCLMEAVEIADDFNCARAQKRLAHKDPARLRWLGSMARANARLAAQEQARPPCHEDFDDIPF